MRRACGLGYPYEQVAVVLDLVGASLKHVQLDDTQHFGNGRALHSWSPARVIALRGAAIVMLAVAPFPRFKCGKSDVIDVVLFFIIVGRKIQGHFIGMWRQGHGHFAAAVQAIVKKRPRAAMAQV